MDVFFFVCVCVCVGVCGGQGGAPSASGAVRAITEGSALLCASRAFELLSFSFGVRTGLEGPGLSVSQKIFYCISFVGGQYIWSRLQSFSAFRRWGDSEQRPLARRAWALMQNAEVLYRAASFFNLLLFLYGGRYKTIVERILKARLVYGGPNMNRAVSFEYMNEWPAGLE
ncbi:unnamed protein product [Miscanthus lutarioriparius]|uniref:RING-type E3 ubiquitin transferase (cysteine targeting) n=1 Tax=Miscanthus lutarioriparius TaxID=422564 RepID=A0A811RAJ6_9POAL|nr:unnamed protein product [Miscanthus lutarioriparius]